jgi:hypothetical protein
MAPAKKTIRLVAKEAKEASISRALIGLKDGTSRLPHFAAKACNVNYSTLKNQLSGRLSCKASHSEQQLLSNEQEKVLLKWIKGSSPPLDTLPATSFA